MTKHYYTDDLVLIQDKRMNYNGFVTIRQGRRDQQALAGSEHIDR